MTYLSLPECRQGGAHDSTGEARFATGYLAFPGRELSAGRGTRQRRRCVHLIANYLAFVSA